MTKDIYPDHFFYLAPIKGVTDAPFRNIFHHFFPYFDGAVAPFINPQRYGSLKEKHLRDVLPANNTGMVVVPQLLHNTAEDFIHLANKLESIGHTHINWNLGCPAPMVANKGRGSGLLPDTEKILSLLEDILAATSIDISIKTRLGFRHGDEIKRLLPRLENMRIKEIILHPRLGKQQYHGLADRAAFGDCVQLSTHRFVYNGDIVSSQDFKALSAQLPRLRAWMIGRGALANPFLLGEIKGQHLPSDKKKTVLHSFHKELYTCYKDRLSGSSHLLSRMKQIWNYLIGSFPENGKVIKKIRKASSEAKYLQAIDELFD